MTKKLKIAAAVLVPLMAWGGFKFYQFYDETLYHIKDTELPNAPLFTKIDLSKKGVTQFDFEVDHNNDYVVRMEFFFENEQEREYLEKMLGPFNQSSIKGEIPILTRVTLSKQNSNVPIIQRSSDLRDVNYGVASKSLLMGFDKRRELEPGKYTIVFENFTGPVAYENVRSHLIVAKRHKKYAYFAQVLIEKIMR